VWVSKFYEAVPKEADSTTFFQSLLKYLATEKEHCLTPESFSKMTSVGSYFQQGVVSI
jgi:hypothetical protein